MKNISILFLVLVSALPFTSFAAGPTACPSTQSIIKEGLSFSLYDKQSHMYILGKQSKYGTEFTWNFFMHVPDSQATDTQDAMNKAITALKTTKEHSKPLANLGSATCVYFNNYGYLSFAGTSTW